MTFKNKDHDLFELFASLMHCGISAFSKTVPWFIKAGVNVDERVYWVKSHAFHGFGNTFLSLSARVGCKASVKALLSQKVDINKESDIDGLRPLHHAVINDHTDVADLLIRSGCEVDALCHNGRTPLYSAISEGQNDIAELLIKLGADVEKLTHDIYEKSLFVLNENGWKILL